MAAIDSAYQYYLSTYGNSTVSRYDTHKKSQLRDTYNKIVKTNKEFQAAIRVLKKLFPKRSPSLRTKMS